MRPPSTRRNDPLPGKNSAPSLGMPAATFEASLLSTQPTNTSTPIRKPTKTPTPTKTPVSPPSTATFTNTPVSPTPTDTLTNTLVPTITLTPIPTGDRVKLNKTVFAI